MRWLTRSLLLLAVSFLPGRLAYAQADKPADGGTGSASASATKQEVEQLRREVAELKATIQQLVEANQQGAERGARLVSAVALQPATSATSAVIAGPGQQAPQKKAIEQKPGPELKFSVGGGEVQIYGHADVSYDYVDNGLADRFGAVGNMGWLSQLSSNLSYFGVRGSRKLVPYLTGVFQVETEVNYSATPGPTSDRQVKEGIGSRDTFVGVQGDWGAVKFGKTDAPYKKSVARLDPFINSIGDSRSIMGNSGGDNRAEFKTRLPHAAWYESPKIRGFNASVLWAPGQNRSNDHSIQARGEPNCSGGNDPPCNDGSYGNVLSANITYTRGPLYLITAYEHHAKVNRTGDEGGSFNPAIPPTGSVGIADESAWEAGVQYTYKPTRTTVNFLYEKLKRYAPAAPAFNERSRPDATWLAFVQQITSSDDFNIGWAFAGRTAGDPGGTINQPGTLLNVAGPINNRANLIDLGLKHHFSDKRTTVYFVFAQVKNQRGAHYAMGPNGHFATIDDKDGATPANTFAGTTIRGVSGGLTYDF